MLKDTFKNEKLKDFMRKEGVAKIREQFSKYIQLLREGKSNLNDI